MKNIEKIAIESLLTQFAQKNSSGINSIVSAKSAVEIAQTNFKQVASPLVNEAQEIAATIIVDLSEDAMKYFEDTVADMLKIPFKIKR